MNPPPEKENHTPTPVSWQEEIHVLAAEFNLTDDGNEHEMFAKALTVSQHMLKEINLLQDVIVKERSFYKEAIREIVEISRKLTLHYEFVNRGMPVTAGAYLLGKLEEAISKAEKLL